MNMLFEIMLAVYVNFFIETETFLIILFKNHKHNFFGVYYSIDAIIKIFSGIGIESMESNL